jgi:phosphoribosylanthranilate isomerase
MDTLIKICGMTRPEDAELATSLGARLIGCTTDPVNPRAVTPAIAKEIFVAGGKNVTKVLCFRGGDRELIAESAKKAGTKHVQLDQYVESVAQELEDEGFTVYRMYRVPVGTNMLPLVHPEATEARPAVLRVADGKDDLTFPWDLLGNDAPLATFISGNVRPENVCALLTHRPYGIDVCRGVERTMGVKDQDRMIMFFDTLLNGY